MAKIMDRVCISIPTWLSDELRTTYPHTEFSALIVQLLLYAHAAGFMKRLGDIDGDDYESLAVLLETFSRQKSKQRKVGKSAKRAAEISAAAVVVATGATTQQPLEEFGV